MKNTNRRNVAAVVAALGTALLVAGCGDDGGSGKSDEDQIRAVVQAQEDAIKAGDAEAFLATFCEESRKNFESSVTDESLAEVNSAGETNAEVTKIEVHGDDATVTISGTIGGEDQGESANSYLKVDGEWKDCTSG